MTSLQTYVPVWLTPGGTGLYDTTLAAYQEARRTWMPGRINIVLIATDGRNDRRCHQ